LSTFVNLVSGFAASADRQLPTGFDWRDDRKTRAGVPE